MKIDNYRSPAARIIGAALTSNKAYTRLAHLTDYIGHRLSGSRNLEQAIAWALAEMRRDRLDNVRGEKVMVPHWVRGRESLELTSPVSRELMMLDLATACTPREGISAALVVRALMSEKLGGRYRKIVV